MAVMKTPIRVRYAETDAAGVVYHTNHLIYFETGRDDIFREIGFPVYNRLRIAEIRCRYLQSLVYDQEVVVETHISNIGRSSFWINNRIVPKEGGEAFTEGVVVFVYVGESLASQEIPHDLKEGLERFLGPTISAFC